MRSVNIFAPWLPPKTKMFIVLSSLFSFEEYFVILSLSGRPVKTVFSFCFSLIFSVFLNDNRINSASDALYLDMFLESTFVWGKNATKNY